ncbi:MAG: hypothetical protein DME50_16065 [Verrucomicrobia bacterium]|nr:MAG: hypothetical protein DME50_16065 [Verrucomicrobiota bacterium]
MTHAIEFDFEAPQHALSPANALDAVNSATAIRAVVVILIMVSPQTCPIKELFNCLSVIQLVILNEAKNLGSWFSLTRSNPEMFRGACPEQSRRAQHHKTRPRTGIAAGTAASTVNR